MTFGKGTEGTMIQGKRIYLRAWERSDLDTYHRSAAIGIVIGDMSARAVPILSPGRSTTW